MTEKFKRWTVELPSSYHDKIKGLSQVSGHRITQNDVLRAIIDTMDEAKVQAKLSEVRRERKLERMWSELSELSAEERQRLADQLKENNNG